MILQRKLDRVFVYLIKKSIKLRFTWETLFYQVVTLMKQIKKGIMYGVRDQDNKKMIKIKELIRVNTTLQSNFQMSKFIWLMVKLQFVTGKVKFKILLILILKCNGAF